MLEKLKTMILSDLTDIEIKRHSYENGKLQKELSAKKEQARNEYKGKNKFKILMTNSFKYKDEESIDKLFYIFFLSIAFLLGMLVLIYHLNCKNGLWLVISCLIELLSLFSIVLLVCSNSDKTKIHDQIKNIKIKIKENTKKINDYSKIREQMFELYNNGYKNYIGISVTKEILEESLKVLTEENIKEILTLSNNDSIEYGYLIKMIIEQYRRNSKKEIYNKLKNSYSE